MRESYFPKRTIEEMIFFKNVNAVATWEVELWNTVHVMAFYVCYTTISSSLDHEWNVGSWDVSSVTDMRYM
jgi:hypothetical protein